MFEELTAGISEKTNKEMLKDKGTITANHRNTGNALRLTPKLRTRLTKKPNVQRP